MPPIILLLIAANVGVYLLQSLLGPGLVASFALWPLDSGLFMPWQIVSYAFLHGSLSHLAFNMFGLWMFGSDLERVWGSRRLAVFYGASVVTAALAQLLVTSATGSVVPTVGASGGLFGLLMGFAMLFPNRKMIFLLLPVPLPAWLFVTLYGAVELALGVTGTRSGIAHFAHLGGLLGGWLVLRYWRGRPPGRR